VITVLIVTAAATAGVAAGSWIYRRIRRTTPPAPESLPVERGPIALGDVLVLDGGHGKELWAARELAFAEGDAPPFLVLFEADGRTDERAILAWDPKDPECFAVLRPQVWPAAVAARLPNTIEIEGGDNRVSIAARRTARGAFSRAPQAEGRSDLPHEGAAVVGIYRGGGRAYAVAVRDSSEKLKLYVGHTLSLSSVSVLAASTSPS
jgi:hypothetical protein